MSSLVACHKLNKFYLCTFRAGLPAAGKWPIHNTIDEVETTNRVKMGLNFGPSNLSSLHSQLPLYCCLPDHSGCLVCQDQRVSVNFKQVLEGASFSHSCYTNIYVYCDINMLRLKTSSLPHTCVMRHTLYICNKFLSPSEKEVHFFLGPRT